MLANWSYSKVIHRGLRVSPSGWSIRSQRPSVSPAVHIIRSAGASTGRQIQFSESSIPSIPRDHPQQHQVRHPISGLTVKTQLPVARQSLVNQLNVRLQNASRAVYSDYEREQLWKAYQKVKKASPAVLHVIPDAAWKRLWQTQSSFRPDDLERLENLQSLLADMEDVGLDATVQGHVLRLERTFAQANQLSSVDESSSHTILRKHESSANVEAIEEWETKYKNKKSWRHAKEWLELGVRLHALAGNLHRVQDLLKIMAHRFQNSDPRFVVFLIQHLNQSRNADDSRRAWALYLQLRRHDKFHMSVNDYETIFFSFLASGQNLVPLATAVLCDLIKAHGEDLRYQHRIFDVRIHDLHKACPSAEDVDKVSLSIVPHLKSKPASDLFFTSWITHSRGEGSADRIAQIIEMIWETGNSPKPYHLDSLIGAWMTSGDAKDSEKAESIAWAMINRRKQLTEHYSQMGSFVQQAARTLRVPAFLRRQLPAAEAHTYIQLMDHYARQGNIEHARHVLNLLKFSPEIKLTVHMVRGILAIHFIMRDFSGAWEFFLHIVQDEYLKLDLRTYAVLWKGLELNLSINKTTSLEMYPDARELFAHMLKRLWLVGTEPIPATRRHRCPSTLYDRILRCFCLSDDTIGSLVAMHAMKDIFDHTPTMKTMDILTKHTAKVAAKAHRKQGIERPLEEFVGKAKDLLESSFVHLTPPETTDKYNPNHVHSEEYQEHPGDHLLKVLSLFLRTHILEKSRTTQKFENVFENAKEAMGLDDLNLQERIAIT